MAPDPQFENIVELYYRDLYRFALSLVRNVPDASDLTQQTFYIWASKGGQLRDSGRVKGWLFTTLHREFLQRARRETRFPHQELELVEDELPPVPPEAIWKMDGEMLLELMGRLDESHRAPLALFYLEEMPYKEIATVLGLPLGTVQSRISRGKALLYKLMGGAAAGPQQKGGVA